MGSDLHPIDHLLMVLEAFGIKSALTFDSNVGIWCRCCGGSCDVLRCGMQQP